MPKKKNEMSSLIREEHLTKHMIIIKMELKDVVAQLDKHPMKMSSVIGARIQIIDEMFRTLNKDEEYRKRSNNYIKELNENAIKRSEEKGYPGIDRPTYMG